MDTTLIVYLENKWKRLDLYENIPISIMIQELDIYNLDERKSPYSKQFVIPNTSNNAIIFEHYFEVNGIEFNPLTRIECVVQYRGVDIFNGFLRLSAVIENPTYTDYEVFIMGSVGDFASEIRDLTLQDLRWDDLQHELSYSAITQSWSADTGDINGLFGGKIIYPMINYGLPYQANGDPVFTYTFGETFSFDQNTNPVPENVWKPAVRVKEIVNRIFERTNYTVVSEFFESDNFRAIYMDTFQNGQLGVETASAVTNQNIFKVYTNPSVAWNAVSGQKDFLPVTYRGDGYDPLNNFVLANSTRPVDPPNQVGGYFIAPYAGQYAWNVKFNYDDNRQCGGDVKFQVIMRKASTPAGLPTGTIIAASDQFDLPTCGLEGNINWFPKATLSPGDHVKVYIKINQNQGGDTDLRLLPYSNYGVTTEAPMWDLYESPELTGTQIVDLRLGLQQINCIEFLKSLIVMFNLVVVQNENDKEILIEPFNWYFNEDDRVERDWTQKQDLNSSYRTEPLSYNLAKEINWTYTKGSEEYLNKLFEDKNKYNYGRYKYVSNNNILTDEQIYELPFAATPTTIVNGSDNFIIPAVYREIDGTNLQPYSNKPHIFFWAGNRFAYLDENKNFPGYWYLQSGTTAVEWSTYPCVSHLSSLDIYVTDLVSDLNFQSTFDFFGNYNTQIPQFTQYNLYNLYWKDYIENTYSNETRRLTGRFILKPTDVYETSLTDKIYVKDSFWRIEKITEASLNEYKSTEVSLIKERGGYYKVDAPGPYYGIEPNQVYPSNILTGATNLVCYTGVTSYPVCQSTALTGTVLSFGASLTPNGIVYYDLGTAFAPLPLGTFLKQTGSTDTYVVINRIGEVIPYSC